MTAERPVVLDGHPSPLVWLDEPPTLRMDDTGRAAARKHIAQGPIGARTPFEGKDRAA